MSALHVVASALGTDVTHSAIAYRTSVDADEIDSDDALGSSHVVPETAAHLRYLRFVGAVPSHGSTVLCDLGATGMTVSVVDLTTAAADPTGSVVHSCRTTSFGGDDFDRLVRRYLASRSVRVETDTARSIKERLVDGGVVTARDVDGGGTHVFTRRDFEDITAGPVRYAAMIVAQTIELSECNPASIVLLGGGANIASIAGAFEAKLGRRTLVPHRPESVAARGAALLSCGQRLTNVGRRFSTNAAMPSF